MTHYNTYLTRACALGLSILFALLLFGTGVAATSGATANPPVHTLRVSFIDVGQGDAALLQDSSGCVVLIDGGTPSAGNTVVTYLHQQGITQVNAMIATHADSDHYGGLTRVLQSGDFSITQVLYNGRGDTGPTWNTFVGAVVSRGLTLTVAQSPSRYTWCHINAEVLNPDPAMPASNDNDASVVLLAEHGRTRYLFTGDMTSAVDARVITRTTALPVDVLKVAHHGSANASSAAFLSIALPKVALISVGPNGYGHPATETLARLDAIGAQIYRTDLSGTITLQDSVTYTYGVYLPWVMSRASGQ
jgi:beta-lactamase superfamily II metal-dependent hydrolase